MKCFIHVSSIRKTWGCGAVKSEKEIAAYNVIREQHLQLGPMCFGELSVLALFSLLVALWFTREPGFVTGWATHTFNAEAEYDLQYVYSYLTRVCMQVLFQKYWNNNMTFWCLISCTFRYVTDATVAVFIALLLFILPSKPPCLCWSSTGSETGKKNFTQWKGLHRRLKEFGSVVLVCFDSLY